MKGIKRMLLGIVILILGINFDYITAIFCTDTGEMKIIMLVTLCLSGFAIVSGLFSHDEY